MSRLVAGVDEAGCGPLAGPVVVAAVILHRRRPVEGLDDSKKLSPARREALYPQIVKRAVAWRIEFVQVDEIDAINILQARLIDGNRLPRDLPCRAEAVVGGDGLEPAIMAASILAKVARDRAMVALHAEFPQYGFAQHKGYASALHLAALREHGPCPHHRRSFSPVSQLALF